MAYSHSLKKFLAHKFITRFIIPFYPSSSRFFNTNSASHNSKDDCIATQNYHSEDIVQIECHRSFAHDVANVFRTAFYFLRDYNPNTPIAYLRYTLNSMEASGLRPTPPGMWKVRQSAEALFISRYMSRVRKEDVNVFVESNSSIWDDKPRNNTLVSAKSKNLGIQYKTNYSGQLRVCRVMVNQPAVLVIERKGWNESEDEEDFGNYTLRVNLSGKLYNTNTIKIEKNNDLLKVMVPKLKAKWIDEMGCAC